MSEPSPQISKTITIDRSTFDRAEARKKLLRWMETVLPQGADPALSELRVPSGAGLSSETLLFEAEWSEGGTRHTVPLVGRMAPRVEDMPIFPKYDIEGQFCVQRLVGERSAVPVPRMRWLETDPSVLGAPFFLMDRIEGRVPLDLPSYTIEGWLVDASREQQAQLEHETIRAIAGIHQIDVTASDVAFLQFDLPGATPLDRHVQRERDYYKWVTSDGTKHPLLERAFEWVGENWPSDEAELNISWGDARIGNILYEEFRPVGLLDWEVAAAGPRELDIGYLCFFHQWQQRFSDEAGTKGLPHLFRVNAVASLYEGFTGKSLRHLDWYFVYAALRLGIVLARYMRRAIHFGHARWPDDPDDLIPHKNMLQGLLDGTFDPLG